MDDNASGWLCKLCNNRLFSIFGTGLDKIYDLPKFKTVVESDGINFYDYGKAASINKGTAMRVFKEANPNQAKTATDFMKFILKS